MVCAGPATYPLAVLAARLGDKRDAAAAFDDAIAVTARLGAWRWEERITRHRARVL
jgi:hypothetical protein